MATMVAASFANAIGVGSENLLDIMQHDPLTLAQLHSQAEISAYLTGDSDSEGESGGECEIEADAENEKGKGKAKAKAGNNCNSSMPAREKAVI